MDPVLLALTAFMILGSIVALEMKDLLSAVIAIGVVGLGLSILFLLLGAPDIAITQVVVEVIVVTVLIRATTHTGRTESRRASTGLPSVVVGAVLLLVVLGFTLMAFGSLPPFGDPGARASTWYLANARALTGATNVVTAVLLDFRAYDTLGEATVILASIVGVLAILRQPARHARRKPAPPPDPAPLIPPVARPEAGSAPTDQPTDTAEEELEEVLHG